MPRFPDLINDTPPPPLIAVAPILLQETVSLASSLTYILRSLQGQGRHVEREKEKGA